MDKLMAEYLSKLELGPVADFKEMSVIPIFYKDDGPEYLTLKEAMDQNLIVITEVNESGNVGELKVKNLADIPVLLLDGEEIIGAKQNRVLNTTILVAEGSETVIPVSCTEQGRWSYRSRKFRDSDIIAANRVRRCKSITVKDSLRNREEFRSDQQAVWQEINEMSMDAKVSSKTRAMKDVYQSREKNLQEYVEAFPCLAGQKGLIVLINGRTAGFEALSSDKTYQLLHEKFIKSYAIDALLSSENNKSKNNSINIARLFINKTTESDESKHKSVSHGCDYRFETDSIIGSSLIYQNKVIHTAFFENGSN